MNCVSGMLDTKLPTRVSFFPPLTFFPPIFWMGKSDLSPQEWKVFKTISGFLVSGWDHCFRERQQVKRDWEQGMEGSGGNPCVSNCFPFASATQQAECSRRKCCLWQRSEFLPDGFICIALHFRTRNKTFPLCGWRLLYTAVYWKHLWMMNTYMNNHE